MNHIPHILAILLNNTVFLLHSQICNDISVSAPLKCIKNQILMLYITKLTNIKSLKLYHKDIKYSIVKIKMLHILFPTLIITHLNSVIISTIFLN